MHHDLLMFFFCVFLFLWTVVGMLKFVTTVTKYVVNDPDKIMPQLFELNLKIVEFT